MSVLERVYERITLGALDPISGARTSLSKQRLLPFMINYVVSDSYN